MGKVKRARQKYHAAPLKSGSKQSVQQESPSTTDSVMFIDSGKVETIFPNKDLFKGVNIPDWSLNQTLNDVNFDAASTVTSKSLAGTNMKKKDKRKLRHHLWMKKIDTITHSRKMESDRKRRQKTAIVGDMQPLGDTLPTLDLLLRDHNRHITSTVDSTNRTDVKPKAIQNEKRRQKDMLEDVSLFQQVLQHPAFKSNPTATVLEHLQNKLEMENVDC